MPCPVCGTPEASRSDDCPVCMGQPVRLESSPAEQVAMPLRWLRHNITSSRRALWICASAMLVLLVVAVTFSWPGPSTATVASAKRYRQIQFGLTTFKPTDNEDVFMIVEIQGFSAEGFSKLPDESRYISVGQHKCRFTSSIAASTPKLEKITAICAVPKDPVMMTLVLGDKQVNFQADEGIQDTINYSFWPGLHSLVKDK